MITPSFSPTATERVLPKLALDFTTASLDSRVTFTRTTDATYPATYVGNDGYIASATNNQPRFDYSPTTLACKGLLIEESRTNAIKQSEGFNGAVWLKSTVTVSANSTNSPANTLTADTMTAGTVAGGITYMFQDLGANQAAGSYTFSCFVKANTSNYVALGLQGDATYWATCVFNLSTATMTESSIGLGSGVSITSTSITAYKDSWYRLVITIASTGAHLRYPSIYCCPLATGNSFSANFGEVQNNVAGESLIIWGAQFELGAFATSYIPTTTTALTRNADVATMTGYGVVNQGTFVIDATVVSGKTLITSGSVTFAATASTAQKTAVAYDVTNVKKSINAGTVTSAAGATASVDISIGPSSDGYFRKMFFYLPKLIDAELQSFSK